MIIIVFGVSGAGKSLIGSRLAAALGWSFYDADLFHSAENVEKMKHGVALTDEDRRPWLERLCTLMQDASAKGENAVLACSGLRDSYRQRLLRCADARLVFLKGDFALISERLKRRREHFMDPNLLKSQFLTLEEPQDGALVVDIKLKPSEIVNLIRKELKV